MANTLHYLLTTGRQGHQRMLDNAMRAATVDDLQQLKRDNPFVLELLPLNKVRDPAAIEFVTDYLAARQAYSELALLFVARPSVRILNQSPQVLELVDDWELTVVEPELFALVVALGYAHKVNPATVDPELARPHLEEMRLEACKKELMRADHHDLLTVVSRFGGECSMRCLVDAKTNVDHLNVYLARQPPEVRERYEQLQLAVLEYEDGSCAGLEELQQASPDLLESCAFYYLIQDNLDQMDAFEFIAAYLCGRGEYCELARLFPYLGVEERLYVATHKPEVLEYLPNWGLDGECEQLRDLFMLHGCGRKLDAGRLDLAFVERYAKELGVMELLTAARKSARWRGLLLPLYARFLGPVLSLRELVAAVNTGATDEHLQAYLHECTPEFRRQFETVRGWTIY